MILPLGRLAVAGQEDHHHVFRLRGVRTRAWISASMRASEVSSWRIEELRVHLAINAPRAGVQPLDQVFRIAGGELHPVGNVASSYRLTPTANTRSTGCALRRL